MKLEIDRAKWQRGFKYGCESRLVSAPLEVPSMCCLGFLGKACGYSDDELRGVAFPDYVDDLSKWPPGILAEDEARSEVTRRLLDINDDYYPEEQTREIALAAEFAKIGIEVTFTGEG
jgi:hypothetical protein